jgi:5'-nucleotidase
MFEKPVVLVDMDNVLAKFNQGVTTTIETELPQVDARRQIKSFYIADDFPEISEIVKNIPNRLGFFSTLQVMEGAIEAWAKLIESGYHPRVCSSPLKTHPNCKNEKLEWLDIHFSPHFGPQVRDEAYIESDKTKFDGLALIDDKPNVRGKYTPTWKQILFAQSHNVFSDAEYKLNSWSDEQLVPMLGKIATLNSH